jgi:hypothetical protein
MIPYYSVVSSSFEVTLRRVASEFDTNVDVAESPSCDSGSVVSSFWEAILWGLPLTVIVNDEEEGGVRRLIYLLYSSVSLGGCLELLGSRPGQLSTSAQQVV